MAASERWFDELSTETPPPAPRRPSIATPEPSTLTCLCGLDDRDVALIAGACGALSKFLARLANGDYEDRVAIQAGYLADRSGAADDAERLHDITERIRQALGTQSPSRFGVSR